MLAAAELLHIAGALKADSKQSIQIEHKESQNRICKKLSYVYGCQGLQQTATGAPKK